MPAARAPSSAIENAEPHAGFPERRRETIRAGAIR